LCDALAATDRTVKSKKNSSDVISEVVFSEIVEMPVHEKKEDHKTYLEKTLDFSLFDLPNLGTGPKAPVFLLEMIMIVLECRRCGEKMKMLIAVHTLQVVYHRTSRFPIWKYKVQAKKKSQRWMSVLF
jgi:hypothetical protein